jgi:hypothetical protein
MSNIVIYTIGIVLILSIIHLNNKLETFKKEKFDQQEDPPTHSSIDAVSVSNLATLASNLISNNGQDLTLNFETVTYAGANFDFKSNLINFNDNKIRMEAFKGMVCPFFVNIATEKDRLEERGWFLCDGKKTPNGTDIPNLINRFIYGGTNTGATGGEKTVKLEVAHMPSHKHRIYGSADEDGWPKQQSIGFQTSDKQLNKGKQYDSNATGNRTNIDPAGGNQPHNNMPPYMVLAYFIYLPGEISNDIPN